MGYLTGDHQNTETQSVDINQLIKVQRLLVDQSNSVENQTDRFRTDQLRKRNSTKTNC